MIQPIKLFVKLSIRYLTLLMLVETYFRVAHDAVNRSVGDFDTYALA